MRQILFYILCCVSILANAQYIGVRARYTETRLVDDSPNPPKRENRLILSFFEVSPAGVYSPTVLSNYDIWIYKQGLQYGNVMGGVLDSTGNNYPGYSYTAPKVVSYYNTLGLNYIDCDPNAATHYVVNGHELDCGFVTVSYWDIDYGTGAAIEAFPAPNVCLTLYPIEHPYYFSPGNLNFSWGTIFPGPPYNMYNFSCGGPLQLVVRGLLPMQTDTSIVVLPVRFANVRARINADDQVTISWSNMTESDILEYAVEESVDGRMFESVGTIQPTSNSGGQADYIFYTHQTSAVMYYRIKATENTGAILLSNVMVVKRDRQTTVAAESFKVYPNPATGTEITIRLENAEPARYICSVINADGQFVRHKMIEHNNGVLLRQIDMTGLPLGVYQIVLRNSNKKFTQRISYVH
jgi:hypothetical protein